MPEIGPVTAASIAALAAPTGMFTGARDFAAWIGLMPRQHSTGGRTRLGKLSKMGQRDLRRLLVIGAISAIQAAKRRAGGVMSRPHVGAQTQDAGYGRTGEHPSRDMPSACPAGQRMARMA